MEYKRHRPDHGSEAPRRRTEGQRERASDTNRRPRPTEGREYADRSGRRPRSAEARESRAESAGRSSRRRPEEERTSRVPGETTGNGEPRSEKPRERKKSPPPSERSIKAAKKRKAIRAENARLHRLRESQKRKAKRRTVKRIDKGLFKRLLLMTGVIIAVILSMVIFFRVETIQILGNSYYSREEVLQACGVATGDNLLTLSRGKISGSIMAPLRYVESVKVDRQLPNTLIIRITEGRPRYAVQDTDGNYFLINAQGKVMEQIQQRQASEFTLVQELLIEPPALGEEIKIHSTTEEAAKAKGQLTAMKILLTAIEEAALGRHIASVQIPSSFKVALWYEDRFLVELGDTGRIDYKLEYLKAVVEKEESYVTGTVDLTLRDGDKAILARGE